MKHSHRDGGRQLPVVAPSRERGLKQDMSHGTDNTGRCRSLTGAWIETGNAHRLKVRFGVAPSRERGLKHPRMHCRAARQRRSLTGAWIETRHVRLEIERAVVAPSRERGLKHAFLVARGGSANVAPSRERGLKLLTLRSAWKRILSLPHGSVD